MSPRWQRFRLIFTILAGTLLLIFGVIREDSAMLMVGGGLVGFSPAAKGP